MKNTMFRSLVLAAVLSVSSLVAFADGSREVFLSQSPVVNGVKLNAGNYKVDWKNHSPEATVTFSKKGIILATIEGVVEDRAEKARHDSVLYAPKADGTLAIKEIRFAGKRQVLVFNQ
jgi:hypothetical protein